MSEKRSFETFAESRGLSITYKVILFDKRNDDCEMLSKSMSRSEIEEMIKDPKYRPYTVIGTPNVRTAVADNMVEFKIGKLTKAEASASLKNKLGMK